MISIVSPVYNEAENLEELCKRVAGVLDELDEKFEYILVENGSEDDSLNIIKQLMKKDDRIKFVSLSRNFGHQGGIWAGMNYAVGDAVISLDGDLQHPPELIREMVALWKQGYDVVYTSKKINRDKKDWRFYPTDFFYKLISYISDVQLTYGQSDYRLLDRKVADVICQIPEKNKFLRGMVEWVGFRQIGIEYEVAERKRGQSKFMLRHLINFAFDGIFSFSTLPLRLFLWVGLTVACFCGLYAFVYFFVGLLHFIFPNFFYLPPGWATIAVSITFLGGIQLIGIGCLGEYIGRIYAQTKQRPDFIVKEKSVGNDVKSG